MKIDRFETFLAGAGWRNFLFIRLHTNTGLTGIGEATLEWQEKAVQTLAHEWVEGRVLGRDPFDIEAIVGHETDEGPPQFATVHGIEVSNDGLVYVADRNNSRIQVFTYRPEKPN